MNNIQPQATGVNVKDIKLKETKKYFCEQKAGKSTHGQWAGLNIVKEHTAV